MNANELAEIVESAYPYGFAHDAALMLRQQQAEIESLRNQLWDFKSEPWGFDRQPVKELTDEEIANTWDDVRKDATLKPSMKDIQDFARAILRKAQEK